MNQEFTKNPTTYLTSCTCSPDCQGHTYICGEMIDIVIRHEDEEDL